MWVSRSGEKLSWC